MSLISRIFKRLYIQIINSIAFYPAIISIGFLLFSLLIMRIEYTPFIIDIKKGLKPMLVQGLDNARLILGTVSGSIFSLMVFSFSMVMLVLNRASSTLSPRVIPGLITKKSHQVVLGMYLGTIIYCLILIVNIQSETAEYQIPTLGILLAMIFAITCLGMFVYFIDSISKSIQVDNILQRIFKKTLRQLRNAGIPETPASLPNTDGWFTIYSSRSGYMKQIELKNLARICQANDLTVKVTENPGFFFVSDYPIAKVSRKVDAEIADDIRNCFIFYIEEHVSDHYLFGFKQISEVAVKALSPGINDPATAIKSLDMLSILFIEKMELNEKNYITDDRGKLLIFFQEPSLEELLFVNLTPIREYGKTDATIMLKILESLKNLAYADKDKQEYQNVLTKYMQSMIFSAEKHIHNDLDLEQIDAMIDRINYLLGKEYSVGRQALRT